MELVRGKDVGVLLYPPESNTEPPLSFKRRMEIARDCALGMIELHSLNPPIMYRHHNFFFCCKTPG